MHFLMAASHVVLVTLVVSLAEAKFYRPVQYNLYKSGPSQHHEPAPTARHKNHCAYVVEKTVTFTVQAGAAPVVKAEYNKCAWGKKCPALQYRLMYKPMYKVAHKSVTELEWRCCPGYSGYGCMEGHYQHSMKALPPFKGPQQQFKGPQFKGPPMKGPMYKGPPMKGPVYKGPPVLQHNIKSSPWSGNRGAHAGPILGSSYPGRHFGPHVPSSSSYPDSRFEPYPSEPEPLPEHQDPHEHHHHHTEHEEVHEHEQVHEHMPEHHGGGGEPEEHVPQETAPPAGGDDIEGQAVDSETDERLGRMEEDVRRLNLGLETLRGTVDGLEDGLRASLREDANRMLSALLSAAPGGPLMAAPALASSHSAVGFGDIPGGEIPEGDMDARPAGLLAGGLPGLGELNGRLDSLRSELLAKAAELQELRATVMGHDGALSRLSGSGGSANAAASLLLGEDAQKAMETLVDAKMSQARAEILGGFERRVESAEERCEEKAGEVRRQCQRERGEGREQMEEALSAGTSHLRKDLASMQAQIHGMETAESCCDRTSGLDERLGLLEQSVSGLNQSQQHLRADLGGHKDHMEGMVAGRLEYLEAKLNLTETEASSDSGAPGGLEAHLDRKLRAVEGRLLLVVEELVGNNGTDPGATLEGHAVLPTDLETLRGRLEMDVDRVQKHLNDLELRCLTHSPSSDVQADAGVSGEVDENAKMALEAQGQRLDRLNATLQGLLTHRAPRGQPEGEEEGGPSVQGELSILRFNIQSFNASLTGLTDSVGTVAQHMEQVNSTWTEREGRLAHQMRGVVQLVGRQASMLGAGDRRLTRLKAELAGMKRRLAGDLQGCRTTALGVRREVEEVGGRVSSVEVQCKGLKDMEADLERIRVELEGQADTLLSQVNGTLSSHAQQLSELRDGLLNCTNGTLIRPEPEEPTQQLSELRNGLLNSNGTLIGPEPEEPTQQHHAVPPPPGETRGDTFTLI